MGFRADRWAHCRMCAAIANSISSSPGPRAGLGMGGSTCAWVKAERASKQASKLLLPADGSNAPRQLVVALEKTASCDGRREVDLFASAPHRRGACMPSRPVPSASSFRHAAAFGVSRTPLVDMPALLSPCCRPAVLLPRGGGMSDESLGSIRADQDMPTPDARAPSFPSADPLSDGC